MYAIAFDLDSEHYQKHTQTQAILMHIQISNQYWVSMGFLVKKEVSIWETKQPMLL